MRQAALIILLITCSFISLVGYYVAWADWILDVKTGVYERDYKEAFWETVALVVYTFLAIRFMNTKITH